MLLRDHDQNVRETWRQEASFKSSLKFHSGHGRLRCAASEESWPSGGPTMLSWIAAWCLFLTCCGTRALFSVPLDQRATETEVERKVAGAAQSQDRERYLNVYSYIYIYIYLCLSCWICFSLESDAMNGRVNTVRHARVRGKLLSASLFGAQLFC